MIHYIVIIALESLWTALWIPITILAKVFDRSGVSSHKMGRIWAWGVLRIPGVKLRVVGSEKIDPQKQYIFISNHTSAFDIPAIYWGVKNKQGMLAKKQLKYVPFFGWAMWAAGHFFVDRKNHKKAMAVMDQVGEQMSEDRSHSLVIFAEGTRSRDGQLQPFKKGAFILSLQTGIPIVPVVLNGAFFAKSKKQRRIQATTIEARILDPMDPAEYGMDERQRYVDDAHKLFEENYQAPDPS